MPNNNTQHNNRHQTQHRSPTPKHAHNSSSERKRPPHELMSWIFFWIVMSLCALWILTTIILDIIVYLTTKNPLVLSALGTILAPGLFMRWTVSYLIPMNEQRHQREMAKIESKHHLKKAKAQSKRAKS